MTAPLKFLQETEEELRKVTWPQQQEVVRLTTVVILISLLIGGYIGGLDFLFTKVIGLIIK